MSKQEVMPAGSQSPNANKEQEGQTEEQKGTSEDNANATDGKILGKFKTPEDMATAYSELESTLGRQRQEIGELRKSVEQVAKVPDPGPEPVDFGEERASIQQQIEDGDLSLAEGLEKMSSLSQQETSFLMEQKFSEYDQKRSANDMYSQFVNQNPEFTEWEKSGLLDEEMGNNPMHDKFSAFYALKAKVESSAAFEKGKEEALKLAKGADGTRSILAKPGSQTREAIKPKRGMSDGEKVNGMMAALQAARGQ